MDLSHRLLVCESRPQWLQVTVNRKGARNNFFGYLLLKIAWGVESGTRVPVQEKFNMEDSQIRTNLGKIVYRDCSEKKTKDKLQKIQNHSLFKTLL
jgi:hypothetical protein